MTSDCCHGHGGPAFGQVSEDAGERRLLLGLSFEGPLTGPFGRGRVDAGVGQPAVQPVERVGRRESDRLVARITLHDGRGYRYHSG